jgi:hypothetical protein
VPLPSEGAFVVRAVPEPLGGESAPLPPTAGLLLPLGAGMLLVPAGDPDVPGAAVWVLSPWVTVPPGGQS